ncbi:MAG: hypothetical protein PHC83_00840 [Bacteroidales bacterium]|nr:hypothetical protein [Bacteroidales bacterium]MDD4209252.1 hypothetical protein [Bacteroidales bacterium]
MNKVLIFFLIIISFICISWGPFKPLLTIQEKNLNGNVHIVIENVDIGGIRAIIYQKFNRKGLLEEIRYYILKFEEYSDSIYENINIPISIDYMGIDTSGFYYSSKHIYQYNTKGKILSEKGIYASDTVFLEKQYEYNSDDSIIKYIEYHYENGIPSDTVITQYFYKFQNNILTKITTKNKYQDTTWTIYTYNKSNKVIKIETYDNNNFENNNKVTEFSFNKNGLLVKKKLYKLDEITKKQDYCIVNKYRYKNNQITKELEINYIRRTKLLLIFTTKHRYKNGFEKIIAKRSPYVDYEILLDSLKNPIEYYDYSDSKVIISKIRYKYDSHNNWIEKSIEEDGKENYILQRKIEYYNDN